MNTVGQAFDSALAGLRARYLGKLEEAAAELAKLIAFCEMDSLTPEVGGAARALAHKLTGSGETLGFPRVSSAAASLEAVLEKGPPDTEAVARAAKALLEICRDTIKTGVPLPKTDPAPKADLPAKADPPIEADPRANAMPPPMAEASPELPPLAGPSIIAIHDDAAFARLVQDVFAGRAGILTYPSVAAVPPASAYPPSLVIVDLDNQGSQPGMLGELRARAGFADAPVLALTGQRKNAAVARAVGGAHLEALIKPVTPTELDQRAHAVMQRGRLSVLIGDDDRIVRELLKARFEANRFKVLLAHDGEDVMNMARAHLPSLIILDREMPKIEGLRVLAMLKAEPATHEIPVILLTGKSSREEIQAGRKGGAADYIIKPFAPDHVLARASEILGISG